MNNDHKQYVFLGAGSMAEAIVSGMLHDRLVFPGQITMINHSNRDRLETLRFQYGVQIPADQSAETKQQLIQNADVVILAMKPTNVQTALAHLTFSPNQFVISLLAGVTIKTLQHLLGNDQIPIVRTMPNTSSSIGMGTTGISFSANVSDQQREQAVQIFNSTGSVIPIDESMINMLTGVSGSGPAYVYYFMEAMIGAAIDGGFDSKTATKLVVETVLGAAEMVNQKQVDPAILRKQVTSPNGATEAALQVLNENSFLPGIVQAVLRSAERSAEMGAELSNRLSDGYALD